MLIAMVTVIMMMMVAVMGMVVMMVVIMATNGYGMDDSGGNRAYVFAGDGVSTLSFALFFAATTRSYSCCHNSYMCTLPSLIYVYM